MLNDGSNFYFCVDLDARFCWDSRFLQIKLDDGCGCNLQEKIDQDAGKNSSSSPSTAFSPFDYFFNLAKMKALKGTLVTW